MWVLTWLLVLEVAAPLGSTLADADDVAAAAGVAGKKSLVVALASILTLLAACTISPMPLVPSRA